MLQTWVLDMRVGDFLELCKHYRWHFTYSWLLKRVSEVSKDAARLPPECTVSELLAAREQRLKEGK